MIDYKMRDNYGVIEEIEENSHVDIKSELGYEGGQNSGNQ
ncbi:fibronectin-binding protein A, partial [Staphylococcus aureus M0934]